MKFIYTISRDVKIVLVRNNKHVTVQWQLTLATKVLYSRAGYFAQQLPARQPTGRYLELNTTIEVCVCRMQRDIKNR